MILYHFVTSPFARRVRLAIAMKGLPSPELRDSRANPEHAVEVKKLNPMATVPVLVDGERIVCDSHAIIEYIDRKSPNPPLWPAGVAGAEAHEIVALADAVIDTIVDLGMRYHALHDHASFATMRDQFVGGRAQAALDRLGERVASRRFLFEDRWTAADIALYTTTAWLEGLPARVEKFLPAKHMVSLGWKVPSALSTWAQQFRDREDVRALD
jgi:glutathione S-transferase